MKLKTITFISLCLFFSCASFNVKEERDDLGRINKIYYYDGNKLLHTENIKYYGKTRKARVIIFKKEIKEKMVPYREEAFSYQGNILTEIEYYLYNNKEKIKTGMVHYFVKDNRLQRIAYYGFKVAKYKIGLDYYLYDSKNKITSRRIITYQYNSLTKKNQQTGHYVIKFVDNNITLMEYSYIIQGKSGAQVEKKVWQNPREIKTKLKQIVQTLTSKAQGL